MLKKYRVMETGWVFGAYTLKGATVMADEASAKYEVMSGKLQDEAEARKSKAAARTKATAKQDEKPAAANTEKAGE